MLDRIENFGDAAWFWSRFNGLPTDAAIVCHSAPLIADADQIDEPLIIAQPLRHFFKIGIPVADNDGLGVLQNEIHVCIMRSGDCGGIRLRMKSDSRPTRLARLTFLS